MQQEQAIYLLEQVLNGKKITRRQFTGWLSQNNYPHSKNTITRILTFIDEFYGLKLKAKRSKYADENRFYIDWDESDPDALKKYNFAKSLIMNGLLNKALYERMALDEYISISNYIENKGLEYFPDLFRAVSGQHPVKIRYYSFSTGKEEDYLIEPVLLREYLNRWYVISQNTPENKKEVPIFALDRIKDLEVKYQSGFKKNKEKDWAGIFRHLIGISLYGEEEDVILRVSSQQAFFFKTLPFHSSQQLLGVDEEGYHTFKYRLRTNFELGQWIHHYTPHVEVLAPAGLRERIKNEAENMYKIHQKNL